MAKGKFGHGSYGENLRRRLEEGSTVPFMGIYDVFSATLASRHFDAIFCSGYGFSASYYGLPDVGYISWTDMVDYVARVRFVLPETHILVDIDDGYGDATIATSMVKRLEQVGASGIVFEDQKRPKKCGHLLGKQIIPLSEYLERLAMLLEVRKDLFIIARTDASTPEEGIQRAVESAKLGADAVLVDGLKQVEIIHNLRAEIPAQTHIVVNVISGGMTPPISLTELSNMGVGITLYSTLCLFAAHQAIEEALGIVHENDGELTPGLQKIGLGENNNLLRENERMSLHR